MTLKNISKTHITAIIGSVLLLTISVLQSKPAFANNPSEVAGRVYMMDNGAKFPLKDVDVEKQGYCGNNPDRGTLCPACPGDVPANPACWTDRVIFYTTDNPRLSPISNGAEYRIGKYKTDTEEGPDPTFRGNITYSGNTAVCTAGVSNGWCGLNCALGPARWHASFPAGYSSANFPSGLDMRNGRWIPHLPPQGDPDWVNDWIEGDYFKLMPGNDANYQFYDFEWAPNKTCAVNLSSSSVPEGVPVTATVTGYANSGAGEPVRLWLEKSDGTPIAPTPSGADHRIYSGKHQYFLPPGCSSSANICSSPPFTATLPAGDYRYHCDLPTDPGKCSGNPFCTYKGGAIDCAGWTQCGPDDSVALTVNTLPTLSLQISNNPNRDQSFTSNLRATGRQNTQAEGGQGWYNPMTITLNANPNSGSLTKYYAVFYDKTLCPGNTPCANTLNEALSKIDSDQTKKNGFALAYGQNIVAGVSGNHYYIRNNGAWVNIDPGTPEDYLNQGYQVQYGSDILYWAYPVSAESNYATWKIRMQAVFGSKSLFTAVGAENSAGLAVFERDREPN